MGEIVPPVTRRSVIAGGAAGVMLAVSAPSRAADAEAPEPLTGAIWLEGSIANDSFALFRAIFSLDEPADVEIRSVASDSYVLWLDGAPVTEGPLRFEPTRVEYVPVRRRLPPGRHVLAAQVRHNGVETRYLYEMSPFFWCNALDDDGRQVALPWRAQELKGQTNGVRRVSPQLGWVEWRDTRREPVGWREPAFSDRDWPKPRPVSPKLPKPIAAHVHAPLANPVEPKLIASGDLAENFGYEADDPSMRFFIRDLAPTVVPAQGIWARYDLGRVRLGRAVVAVDAPPGSVVEVSMSEDLTAGRVNPVITLSLGGSCNLDHFTLQGGPQSIRPHDPRGGRFLEVHVLAPPGRVRALDVGFIEREYHGPPAGTFRCHDKLLERIWTTGVETYRACTEDAVTDNPTRERGQWLGDAGVALETATAAYGDPALVKRLLVHAARSAREDGLVAGLSPTQQRVYIPSFAALWTVTCQRLHQLTGDRALLEELFPAAERNIAAFRHHLGENGIRDGLGWSFIDWGYQHPPGGADPALTLFHLASLRAMIGWSEALGRTTAASLFRREAALVEGIARRRLKQEDPGYHVTVLALLLGLVEDAEHASALVRVETHMLACFPNDPAAPRLSDPSVSSTRIITPYFAHFALRALLEAGEGVFVHEQYRRCWGWWLRQGKTTWMEVFDPRWSHCHQWSAAPTWQLSRYALGLHPRRDLSPDGCELKLVPGALRGAEGKVPLGLDGAMAKVEWKRRGPAISYRLTSSERLVLHDRSGAARAEVRPAQGTTFTLREDAGVWRMP